MRLFEYCQRERLLTLTDDQRRFVTTLIKNEVEKVAKKEGISKDDAYWRFSHGLTEGSDRIINDD
ncbi:MAG: hypothetical protein IJI65_02585 [Lachnospiraceae bacterium]|nr:hypothetical protein [Lachnospiraceae bacterium]